MMESAWRLAGGPLLDLSEQQVLDCVPDNSCKGNAPLYALQSAQTTGLIPDADRRFVAKDLYKCSTSASRVVAKFAAGSTLMMWDNE
jgi:hypothetical protein